MRDQCFIFNGDIYMCRQANFPESGARYTIVNQDGCRGHMFGEIPHYVALGHIHKKPQVVPKSKTIHLLSGFPIPLSFLKKRIASK